MWYLPKESSKGGRWIIGKSKNLGKMMGSIISPDDVDKPQEATTWKYFDGDNWKSPKKSHPRNVIVTALLNSKNSAKTPKKTPQRKSKRTPKRTSKRTPKRKTKKTPKRKTKKTSKRKTKKTPKRKTKRAPKRTTKQQRTTKES